MTGSGKFAILAARRSETPVDLISVCMHVSLSKTHTRHYELSNGLTDVAAMNKLQSSPCAQSREDWSVQHTKVTLMKPDDHQITAFMTASLGLQAKPQGDPG